MTGNSWGVGLKNGLVVLVIVGVATLGFRGFQMSNAAEVEAYAACVVDKIEDVTAPAPARIRQLKSYSEELWPHRGVQVSRWAEGNCQAANEKWHDMEAIGEKAVIDL